MHNFYYIEFYHKSNGTEATGFLVIKTNDKKVIISG